MKYLSKYISYSYQGNDQANYFRGGIGNDRLYGNGGNDVLYGGDGNDRLYGGNGHDKLYGDDGDDQLYGGIGNDRLYGGDGNDELYGGIGTDWLYGDDGDDWLEGGDGHFRLEGGDGNDWLEGGSGNDALFGGSGDDTLISYTGNEFLFGGDGNDTMAVYAGGGNSRFYGQADNDMFVFFDNVSNDANPFSNHFLTGGTGVDTVHFASLGSAVTVNLGAATASGDFFTADVEEMENVLGTDFNDSISGDSGDNILNGNDGNDTIWGGGGDDTLIGGNGNDVFIFDHDDYNESDIIQDFNIGNQYSHDVIDLDNQGDTEIGSWWDLTHGNDGDYMEQVGDDVVIHSSDNDTITLTGIDMDDLTQDHFLF